MFLTSNRLDPRLILKLSKKCIRKEQISFSDSKYFLSTFGRKNSDLPVESAATLDRQLVPYAYGCRLAEDFLWDAKMIGIMHQCYALRHTTHIFVCIVNRHICIQTQIRTDSDAVRLIMGQLPPATLRRSRAVARIWAAAGDATCLWSAHQLWVMILFDRHCAVFFAVDTQMHRAHTHACARILGVVHVMLIYLLRHLCKHPHTQHRSTPLFAEQRAKAIGDENDDKDNVPMAALARTVGVWEGAGEIETAREIERAREESCWREKT